MCASVFAIGDVTNRINLTPVAIAEGHSLADILYGPTRAGAGTLDRVASAVFTSRRRSPASASPRRQAAAAWFGADIYLTASFTPMRHALSGRHRPKIVHEVGGRPADVRCVLGAHMIGEDAPEIMQGLSIAINCRCDQGRFRPHRRHPPDGSAEEFVTLRTRTRVAEGPSQPEQDAQSIGKEEIGAAEMGLGA